MSDSDHDPSPAHPHQELAFYASAPHDCAYLPGRSAVTVFADPKAPMDQARYSALAELGFRRSGGHIYTPHCPDCRACVATRIPVADFRPNRAQRRTQKQSAGLSATVVSAEFRSEHFTLYRRYISTRHAGGGMDDPGANRYMEFLTCDWAQTEFVEFRDGEHLVAMAVMDVLSRGLSCVYTFFDPDYAGLSPGRAVLLWQIDEARHRGLPWLFLGFWIDGCQKMQYKQEYRPLELFLDGHWQRFARHQPLPSP